MLTTDTAPTIQAEATMEVLSDADLLQRLDIPDDGLILNARFMWHEILNPKHKHLVGDELIVLASIASLTKNPYFGCTATHKAVATRATSLKKLFTLASTVGWPRIARLLNVTE